MQRITIELIRKRCEHNDGEVGSLEEIALHQQNIGKLENIQHWCKNLKILLLHNNLISKIENLHKLKNLEYINFSINNITKIENLEGCESLNKLDFTLNFIGDLISVESLKANIHLKCLHLIGNPCAYYEGYREYVIATLLQLEQLDGKDIQISERIKALQKYGEIVPDIKKQQNEYLAKWYKTRTEKDFQFVEEESEEEEEEKNEEYPDRDEELRRRKEQSEQNEKFWQQSNIHCPEVRIEIAKQVQARKESKEPAKKPKKRRKLFTNEGKPLNVNQPNVNFLLDDDYWNSLYTLDVSVYRYLDTSLVEADVNPFYVRVIIKGKILQLQLSDEVCPDKSVARRSQTTGHLVITMPKVKEVIRPHRLLEQANEEEKDIKEIVEKKTEFLEVQGEFDLKKILTISDNYKKLSSFTDNPEVPPLE